MEIKHTAGPWKWVELEFCGKYHALQDQSGVVICDDGSASGEYSPEIDVNGANARLIAAAPELLEALELLETTCELGLDYDNAIRQVARAAIRKAKGE